MEVIQIIIAILMMIISIQIMFLWVINSQIERNLKKNEKWLDTVKDSNVVVIGCEHPSVGAEEDTEANGDMSFQEEESAYNTYLTIDELRDYFWNKRN